jgi:hypothetical protein
LVAGEAATIVVGDVTAVSVGGSGVGMGFEPRNLQANVANNRLNPAHIKDLKFFFITVLQ